MTIMAMNKNGDRMKLTDVVDRTFGETVWKKGDNDEIFSNRKGKREIMRNRSGWKKRRKMMSTKAQRVKAFFADRRNENTNYVHTLNTALVLFHSKFEAQNGKGVLEIEQTSRPS